MSPKKINLYGAVCGVDKMILPTLFLPSRQNQQWLFSGMDHYSQCLDKKHFKSYPYSVEYTYNSRGFRDHEWPESVEDLKQAIWCVGDSFTVGIGSPYSHTWPARLAALTGRRTVNVSMDGASNQWISRVTKQILEQVAPKDIVIMWSYTHRREHPDASLSDEDRRIFAIKEQKSYNENQDWENFQNCRNSIVSVSTKIQFAVPNFQGLENFNIAECWDRVRAPDWPAAPTTQSELENLPQWILSELKNLHNCLDVIQHALNQDIIEVKKLDSARDGHHFDLITADWVAQQAAALLN